MPRLWTLALPMSESKADRKDLPSADAVRGILKVMRSPARRVVIENIGASDEGSPFTFVISDEGGEFARTDTVHDALHYAGDLLYGPGTGGNLAR